MASTVFVENIPTKWEFGILTKTYQDQGENHREGDNIGHKMDFFYLVLLKQKLE